MATPNTSRVYSAVSIEVLASMGLTQVVSAWRTGCAKGCHDETHSTGKLKLCSGHAQAVSGLMTAWVRGEVQS